MLNTDADSLLRLEGVTVEYEDKAVLESVNIDVIEGDYLGVVGPSGSGKTTLLKVMAGAIRPTEGKLLKSRKLRIGYVPQVESIDWNFPVTVREVLLMASNFKATPWAAPTETIRAITILEKLGIGDLSKRHIRDLSGGQQQRVFIARALMNRPNIIMLDEPTSGVDVATRHDVLHLLHDLNHDDGVTVIITTHDLNGIAAHMHTLICLNKKVIASGEPRAVMTPEVLEQTYSAPMDVLSHGGMPLVVEHPQADQYTAHAHHDH